MSTILSLVLAVVVFFGAVAIGTSFGLSFFYAAIIGIGGSLLVFSRMK